MGKIVEGKLVRALVAIDLIMHRKDEDWLVLSDEVIRAALSGTTPLSPGEMSALMDSPTTLQRMQVLEAERLAALKGNVVSAANDDSWFGSCGMLLAADSGVTSLSLHTDDMLWMLKSVPAGEGCNLILQLNVKHPQDDKRAQAAKILASGTELAVFDGADVLVMDGILDADGELEKPWPLANELPYAHFMATGGKFTVLPV